LISRGINIAQLAVEHKQFIVGDEKSGYKLTVGGYEGSAGMS
jgi:hypothetical protein